MLNEQSFVKREKTIFNFALSLELKPLYLAYKRSVSRSCIEAETERYSGSQPRGSSNKTRPQRTLVLLLVINLFMAYFHYSTSQITQSMAASEDNSITATFSCTSNGYINRQLRVSAFSCGLGLLLEPIRCDNSFWNRCIFLWRIIKLVLWQCCLIRLSTFGTHH